jgi:hypothetical protein
MVAAELTPSMRAAAETVQAIFLVRELFVELGSLFIEFSFLFRFAFFAGIQSGQIYSCNLQCFRDEKHCLCNT